MYVKTETLNTSKFYSFRRLTFYNENLFKNEKASDLICLKLYMVEKRLRTTHLLFREEKLVM